MIANPRSKRRALKESHERATSCSFSYDFAMSPSRASGNNQVRRREPEYGSHSGAMMPQELSDTRNRTQARVERDTRFQRILHNLINFNKCYNP